MAHEKLWYSYKKSVYIYKGPPSIFFSKKESQGLQAFPLFSLKFHASQVYRKSLSLIKIENSHGGVC